MATMMPEPVQLLRGLLPAAGCPAVVADFDAQPLLQALCGGPLAAQVAARLGAGAWCNLDQCFLRHQYPPATRPPQAHPHSWHQDGAVGHDFALAPEADGGLLAMLTCWIALTPCGADLAPALEWVAASPPRLLAPAELTDDAVRAAFGGGIVAAGALAAGDALLFDGTLLHRTSVHAAMRCERWSAELRFFAAPPERLRGQRFVPFTPARPGAG